MGLNNPVLFAAVSALLVAAIVYLPRLAAPTGNEIAAPPNITEIPENATRIYDAVVCRAQDNGCDYICTSATDCGTVISAAINDTVKKYGHGTVLVRSGNYPIRQSVQMLSNIALVGEGWGTQLRGTTAIHPIIYWNGLKGADGYYQNIEIKDMQLNGTGMNGSKPIYSIHTKNLIIDHLWINGAGGTCIGPDYVYSAIISNNLVENCNLARLDANGIGIGGNSTDVIVSNNIIRNVYGNKKVMYGDGILFERLASPSFHTRATISGNTIYNARNGITLSGITDSTIAGNTIYNSTQYGIHTNGNMWGAFRIVVSGNTIYNSGLDGISISHINDSEWNINGNNIFGNKRYGVLFRTRNSILANNVISNNSKGGVLSSPSGTLNPRANIITGNSILGNGGFGGLSVNRANGTVIANNAAK